MENITANEFEEILAEGRRGVIRECVTWLAQNHDKYKPEFLAGKMADDLLNK